jgi:hypothetical protein
MKWIRKKLNLVSRLLQLPKNLKINERNLRKFLKNLLSQKALNRLLYLGSSLNLSNHFIYLQLNKVNPLVVNNELVVNDICYVSIPATTFSFLYFFILYPIFRGRGKDNVILFIFAFSLCLGIYKSIGWSSEVNIIFGISFLLNLFLSILVFIITILWIRIVDMLNKLLRERISKEEQDKLNNWWTDLDPPANYKEKW